MGRRPAASGAAVGKHGVPKPPPVLHTPYEIFLDGASGYEPSVSKNVSTTMEHGKRPREDDDAFPEKRLRKDPADELTANVCGDICSLDPRSIEDVAYISNPIVIEFEKIDRLRNLFLTTVYAMVTEKPQKMHIVSDLVLICNAKNMVVGKYVVEYVHSKTQEAVAAGQWGRVKTLLKFIATLTPIITEVAPVFRQLMAYAREHAVDELYYGVLMAVPYLFSNADADADANDIVEQARGYEVAPPRAIHRKHIGDEVAVYPLVFKAVDELEWSLLKLFANRRDAVAPILAEALANNPISKEMVQHPFPQLAMPAEVPESLVAAPYFSHIYNHATLFETVPPITSYQGLFFRDLICDTVNALDFNATEAGVQIHQLDLAFPQDLAPVFTLIDQLEMIDADNRAGDNNPPLLTWKAEDVAVENVVNLFLLLPRTPHYPIYYFSVLLVFCHEGPLTVAPVFGRAIRYLYLQLETMDFELRTRFADWMLIQLLNFDFSWKWDEWVADLDLDATHPKVNFIRNLIGKEIRLLTKKRIQELFIAQDADGEVVQLEQFYRFLDTPFYTTPVDQYVLEYDQQLLGADMAEVHREKRAALADKPLVTAQDEIVQVFTWEPTAEIANRVYDFLVSKYPRTNVEFKELVADADEVAKTVGVPNPTQFVVNLFVQTYLFIGLRLIFSAVLIVLRDLAKLLFLVGAECDEEFEQPPLDDLAQRQQWVIDLVIRVWYHHPQMVYLLLEHLADFKIVPVSMVLERYFAHDLVVLNFACYDLVLRMDAVDAMVPLAADKVRQAAGTEWMQRDYQGLLRSAYRQAKDPETARQVIDGVISLE